jgi:hypothetical protein
MLRIEELIEEPNSQEPKSQVTMVVVMAVVRYVGG